MITTATGQRMKSCFGSGVCLGVMICLLGGCGTGGSSKPDKKKVDTFEIYEDLKETKSRADAAREAGKIQTALDLYQETVELADKYFEYASLDDAMAGLTMDAKKQAEHAMDALGPQVHERMAERVTGTGREEDAPQQRAPVSAQPKEEEEEKQAEEPPVQEQAPQAGDTDTAVAHMERAEDYPTPVVVESLRVEGDLLICRFIAVNKNASSFKVGPINLDFLDDSGQKFYMHASVYRREGFEMRGGDPAGELLRPGAFTIPANTAVHFVAVAPKAGDTEISSVKIRVGNMINIARDLYGEGP